jgi:glycosyltransferase involved in cell wall biosynthesis
MTSPLVSVVIPCHNHASLLPEAIDSALSQSYGPVEVVVVDDGSTDDTARVAESYSEARLLRQSNQGLSAARNTGLRDSRGRYVVFLDADDRLCREALAAGLACFQGHGEPGMAVGRYRIISADGATLAEPQPAALPGDDYTTLLQCNWIEMHAAVMYRRAALDAVGWFDTRRRACEDYDLYLRMARRFSARRHTHIVAEYRRHDQQMSRDPLLMLAQGLAVLHGQRPYVRNNSRHRRAYLRGCASWRQYYGERSIRKLGAQLEGHAWAAALLSGAVLLRHYPAGLLRAVGSGIIRRTGGAETKMHTQPASEP